LRARKSPGNDIIAGILASTRAHSPKSESEGIH
jgi:hypothetical protein